MTTKITLDIDEDETPNIPQLLRDAATNWRNGHQRKGLTGDGHLYPIVTALADQIEAQLPKPLPPEPEGDCVVKAGGEYFHYEWDIQVWRGSFDGTDMTWLELSNVPGGFKVYRPEPSPERVEELIEVAVADPCSIPSSAVPHLAGLLREFAAALLAGGAAK